MIYVLCICVTRCSRSCSCSHLIVRDHGFESRCAYGFYFLVLVLYSVGSDHDDSFREVLRVCLCVWVCVWLCVMYKHQQCSALGPSWAFAPPPPPPHKKENPLIIYSWVAEAPNFLHDLSRNKPWDKKNLDHVILSGKGKGSPYNRPLRPRGWVEV